MGNRGAEDDLGALRLRGADEVFQIPAEGVDLLDAAIRLGDLFDFIADALDRATELALLIERADVVVAELDDHEVILLQSIDNLLPAAFGVKGPRGAATDGAVDDVDHFRVEEVAEILAPAAHRQVALHGGVSGDPKGRESGVAGLFRCRAAILDDGSVVFLGGDEGAEKGEQSGDAESEAVANECVHGARVASPRSGRPSPSRVWLFPQGRDAPGNFLSG